MSTRASAPLAESAIEMLGNLESPGSRRVFLDRNPEVVRPESVEALAEAVRRYVRLDVRKAQRAADAALAIAERLEDPASLGRALRAKGNAHWFEGDCRTAVEVFKRAVELFREAGEQEEIGRTLSSSIQPLILLGHYETALENAARAQEIFFALKDDLRLARLDINAANIYHRQERYADALERYERAYRTLVPLGDAEGVGVSLHNMAVCLISLDEFDRALEIYEQARHVLQEKGMPRLVLQADYNIAYLYHLRGEYQTAIRLLRAARDKCAEGDSYHAALCDLDLSEIYLELNLWTEAMEMASRAASLFETLGTRYERARSVANMAIAASRRRSKDALALFERARELFRAEHHATGEALVGLYQAIFYCESGDRSNAAKLCRDAGEVFRASALDRKAALCDLLLSRLALMDGSIEAADAHCRAAEERLACLEAPMLNYQAHRQRGRIHEARGDAAAAARAFSEAADELESVRCALDEEELRIAFASDGLDIYERLAALALEEGYTGPAAERAFGYIERAKSRSLAESIFGRTVPLAAQAGRHIDSAGTINRLRQELNWYYHRIQREEMNEDGVDPHRIQQLRTQVRAREHALLKLLRENPPSSSQVGDAVLPGLPELRAAIEPRATVVEYFQLGSRIMAACVKRTSIDIVPLADDATVRRRIRSFQLQLSRSLVAASQGNSPVSDARAVNRHLHDLYRDVMTPLERHLEGDHLILVPHGCLHYLPFHALHDGNNYLIDRFTISYAPSAQIYSLCRGLPQLQDSRPLVMGIEDARAPWIADEVREVASVIPGARLLVGNDASVKSLEEWGDRSPLVHIATHGSFRTDNPLFSAVQLGDSYLSVYDLYNLRLRVELLTLSGCGTGLNVVAAGDELVGLVRGLLYSGVRSVLLTLWDVHDQSAAMFMKLFYSHLAATGDKAGALRAAMLDTRACYAHPCYWAPFLLVGKVP